MCYHDGNLNRICCILSKNFILNDDRTDFIRSRTSRRLVSDQSQTSRRLVADGHRLLWTSLPNSRRPMADLSPTDRQSVADRSLTKCLTIAKRGRLVGDWSETGQQPVCDHTNGKNSCNGCRARNQNQSPSGRAEVANPDRPGLYHHLWSSKLNIFTFFNNPSIEIFKLYRTKSNRTGSGWPIVTK